MKAPEGFDHREWWFGIKMARAALLRPLPLLDKNGRPFRFAMVDPLLEMQHRIDSDASVRLVGPHGPLSAKTRDRYILSSLMEESITSSQLEGAATTRKVAKQMLSEGRKPRNHSERMIFNNFQTMQWIREQTDQELTPELVFDLHRRMTEGTLDDPGAAGRFRTDEENIVVAYGGETYHEPPAATELPVRLDKLCAFANGKSPDYFVHPVVRAVLLHFWLAFDHPFVDGNGRTARALFYWSMLSQGYGVCEFLPISRKIKEAPARYARAYLYSESDEGDLTYFLLYHVDVLQRALVDLGGYLRTSSTERRSLEERLAAGVDLNHRQKELLAHALKHPDEQYTIAIHRTRQRVVYQTARADLLELHRLGLLEKRRSKKAFYFMPSVDLEDRIRELR
ncbi:MAG: Fic family protein [Planctomycetes bacterium]|nr:Fic family protein [Planctomycetota bacterium]